MKAKQVVSEQIKTPVFHGEGAAMGGIETYTHQAVYSTT